MSDNTKLPEFIELKLQQIGEKTGNSLESIRKDYIKRFQSDFIQKDPQFQSDEERHKYAIVTFWVDAVSRPSQREYAVIPIGFDGLRFSKQDKNPYSSLYALVKGQQGIRRIACNGPTAELYKHVNTFCLYNVKLGAFKDSDDLIADDRSVFENPLKADPVKILSHISIPRITIMEAGSNLSKSTNSGHLIRTDWRVLRGIITRTFSKTKGDGSDFGVYTVADYSSLNGDVVDEKGDVRPIGFTVWVSPTHMAYGEGDECDFYGTVSMSNDKKPKPEMNAFLVMSVRTRPKKEEDGA